MLHISRSQKQGVEPVGYFPQWSQTRRNNIQWVYTHPQWVHFYHVQHFTQHHGFSSRGRIWCTVPEWTSRRPDSNIINRNVSYPATHPDTSGQLHWCCNSQQEHLKKRSKAMDMRFHWIQYRILQEHFHVFWKPGPNNLGDYHSKHHPTPHHIQLRHTNLNEPHGSQNTFQGCVNTPNR